MKSSSSAFTFAHVCLKCSFRSATFGPFASMKTFNPHKIARSTVNRKRSSLPVRNLDFVQVRIMEKHTLLHPIVFVFHPKEAPLGIKTLAVRPFQPVVETL
mmetsp:Transcript_13370/g.26187  ORF Transcript_13370/g.26187 Transcript_13370/m.26187 type:complete len:101 (+) Transcript_13370:249-551(+)